MVKTWLRTTIGWKTFLGLKTEVPVTDWHKKDEQHFIKIHEIKATSLPGGRRGKLELMILRVSVGPVADLPEVLRRLCSLADGRKVEVEHEHQSFTVTFDLKPKEGFVDGAIDVVKTMMNRFGVEHPRDWRVASFSVDHELFYRVKGEWVADEWFHRLRHELRAQNSDEEAFQKRVG